MSVVLVEGVIQVTINPVELWNVTQEVGHLGIIIGFVLVPLPDGVEHLVQIRVDNFVPQVVVPLLPVVLWHVRRIEVNCCHI